MKLSLLRVYFVWKIIITIIILIIRNTKVNRFVDRVYLGIYLGATTQTRVFSELHVASFFEAFYYKGGYTTCRIADTGRKNNIFMIMLVITSVYDAL